MKFNTAYRDKQTHPTVFIGEGTVIVGDVTLCEECSVWFNATLRGDTDPIKIGPRTNIQDGAIFHTDPGFPVVIGAGVTVGHGAVVHGATVGDGTVLGMRSVVLNGAVIGENCIVGANALITEGKIIPSASLVLGSPAKIVRSLRPEEIAHNRHVADVYVKRANAFKQSARL